MKKYSNKLIELIPKIFDGPISEFRDKKIVNLLKFETSFLNYDASPIQRLYYVKFNLFKQQLCPVCNNPTKIKKEKTEYRIQCCSISCSKLAIDPKTNKTKAAISREKTDITMKQIDPKTGLTKYQTSGKKIKKTLNTIDSKTGLSGYQENGLKTKKSKQKINPTSGLSGYQEIGLKISQSKLAIDPKTNKTKAAISREKTDITMKQIDPKTGLTKYHIAAKKASDTMHTIVSDTGLNLHQLRGNKIKITNKTLNFNVLLDNFPENYTLLTLKKEYINSNRLLKYQCKKCNSIRESYWPYIRCVVCYPYNKSIAEHEILEYCKTLTQNIKSNSRSILTPLELDIYIPNHNLAIEYNGLYWHSSDSVDSENKDYHLNKTQLCQEQGIQLFHIFENEWLDPTKQQIWKSIIKNKLGQSDRIYARKTEVALVSSNERKKFLTDNHLQGDCVSSVNLGLFLDGELMSLMTFGKSRYKKDIDWELLRFCNKIGCSVIGGAGKLLKQFKRENIGSIISYADKRRSNGNLYRQLGFVLSHESGPNYWYYKDPMILESRIKYQKHKLKDKLDIFDENLTESENMYLNGYRKIYDCGNQVWVL